MIMKRADQILTHRRMSKSKQHVSPIKIEKFRHIKSSILFVLTSLFLWTNLYAQEKLKGNKNVITQNREITYFDAILVKDNLKVMLTESPVSKVSVETDDNLQIAVETRVSNNTLEIYLAQPIARKKKLNIYVGVTDSIQRIEAREQVSILGENEIHTNNIELIAHDNAMIKLNFRTTNFTATAQNRSNVDCTISASNNISITLEQNAAFKLQTTANKISASLADSAILKPRGNCQEVEVIANDNASFRGKDLLTDYASIQATDRTNVYINASKEVLINSQKNATIHLYANPKISIEKFVDKSTLHKK